MSDATSSSVDTVRVSKRMRSCLQAKLSGRVRLEWSKWTVRIHNPLLRGQQCPAVLAALITPLPEQAIISGHIVPTAGTTAAENSTMAVRTKVVAGSHKSCRTGKIE